MGAPKSWRDQPGTVLGCDILASFSVRSPDGTVAVEVRREIGPLRLVTVGNLFGSQTFRCDSDEHVYKLLAAVSDGTDKRPKGCEEIS